MEKLKKLVMNTPLEKPARRLKRFLEEKKRYHYDPIFTVDPQIEDPIKTSSRGTLYFSPKFTDSDGINAFIKKKGYRSITILGDSGKGDSLKIDCKKCLRVSNLRVGNPLEEALKTDAVLLITSEQTGQYYLRVLINLYQYRGDVLLPSTKEGSYGDLEYESPEPIITCAFPCAGTMRFLPCMVEILKRLGRFDRHYTPTIRNLKHIRRSQDENGYHPPDEDVSNKIFYHDFKRHDYYECSSIHEWIRLGEFADLDCHIVVLMRDPRDVINSYFWHLVGDDERYKKEKMDEIILDVIKGSTRFVWSDLPYALNWPSAKTIVDSYVAAEESPNMFPIRFEDLHKDEVSAYRNLLKALKLYPHPFVDFSDEKLKEIAYLGSFEYQTQGRRKRGENNKNRLKNEDNSCRKGVVGDWRSSFTPEAVKLFKELTGDGLVKLGYEKDTNWDL